MATRTPQPARVALRRNWLGRNSVGNAGAGGTCRGSDSRRSTRSVSARTAPRCRRSSSSANNTSGGNGGAGSRRSRSGSVGRSRSGTSRSGVGHGSVPAGWQTHGVRCNRNRHDTGRAFGLNRSASAPGVMHDPNNLSSQFQFLHSIGSWTGPGGGEGPSIEGPPSPTLPDPDPSERIESIPVVHKSRYVNDFA